MSTVASVTQQQRLRLAKREAQGVRRLARGYAELTRWCTQQGAALRREVDRLPEPRPSAGQIMQLPSFQAFVAELRLRLRLAVEASSQVIVELGQDGRQLGAELAEAELTAVLGAD